jgi:hypothetical protein
VAEVIEQGVNILEMDEMSFRVLPLRCACGEGIANGCRLRELVPADCKFALGKLEVLGIVT